jgi:sn-glycerol 3-phosphate transport system ATP-binding protein
MEIEFVEELGATQLLHGRVEGVATTVQVATGSTPTSGTVGLSIDGAATHVFDAATGRRL